MAYYSTTVADRAEGEQQRRNAKVGTGSFVGGGGTKYNTGESASSTGTRGSGSSSSGGYSGGGGGGSAPVRREEGSGGGGGNDGTGTGESTLGGLTADEITSAIAYLEAQTGLNAQELMNRNDNIGRTANNLLAQLEVANERALEAAQAGLLRRGILRSGIAARDYGRVGEETGLRAEQITNEQESQQRDIQLQLDSLTMQLEQQKAAMVQQIEASNLGAVEKAALLNELEKLNIDQLNELSISLTGQPISLGSGTGVGASVGSPVAPPPLGGSGSSPLRPPPPVPPVGSITPVSSPRPIRR